MISDIPQADLEYLANTLSTSDIDHALQTQSMHEFIKGCWPTIEPGRKYYDNWHIQAICEHLEAVVRGEITRLIINIPPRHMKSLTCAVAFPMWAWIQKPHIQFLFASYASSLAIRDSVKCRRLLSSPWFQANWGDRFHLTGDQNQKQRFENNHNGHRISTSVGGALTGEGGDIIVIDDPHNVKEAESDAVRLGTTEWWDTAVPSRLNDPKTGAFVIIMQRVHQSDLTGHILKNAPDLDEWTHLCVPAEFENNHPHKFYTSLTTATAQEDPRKEEGALLWSERFGQKELDILKTTMGSYAAAGQLQQRPAPKGGGIIKRKWWRKWQDPQFPEFIYVLQSWDTAYSEQDVLSSSYSACTTWAVFQFGSQYHFMIIHRYRERLPFPELRKHAKELYAEYKPDAVLIEKKASGQSLIQDLKQAGIPALPYNPDKDKVARAHAASVLLESGLVWHPERRWANEVIDHCAVFPAGDGTDIVDTVTQALLRFRAMWFAVPPDDEDYDPDIPDREDPLANIIQFPDQEAIYG